MTYHRQYEMMSLLLQSGMGTGMAFWDFVGKAINVAYVASGAKRTHDIEQARLKKLYRNHSLSCNKCGGLAEPIAGTKRNYRCACGHQFAGANHPL